MKKRKIMSIFLAFLMICSIIPTGVSAEGNAPLLEQAVISGDDYSNVRVYSYENEGIKAIKIPNLWIGKDYSVKLKATNSANSWSIILGNIPKGLSFNGTTGEIYGTPTAFYTGRITVTISNGEEQSTCWVFLNVFGEDDKPVITTEGTLGNFYADEYSSANISFTGFVDEKTAAWSLVSGKLPDGMTLINVRSATCSVSGEPTTPGNYSFRLQISTLAGTAQKDFTMTVSDGLKPVKITGAGNIYTTAGKYLSKQFTAQGTIPIQWRTEGTLPPGLTLDENTGVLSGTPTSAGEYKNITIIAKNSLGGISSHNSETFSIYIYEAPEITSSSFEATNGAYFIDYIKSNHDNWGCTVSEGSLPAGLSLTDTGVLRGTPVSGGTFKFTVRLSCPKNRELYAEREITFTVNEVRKLELSDKSYTFESAVSGYDSVPQKTITVTNKGTCSSGNISVSLYSGNTSDFTITGSPSPIGPGESTSFTVTPKSGLTVGNYNVTIKVSSENAGTQTVEVNFSVNESFDSVEIITKYLGQAMVGEDFYFQLQASGTGPYTWYLEEGNSLPDGLSLSSDGIISGTPTTAGRSGYFTINVSNQEANGKIYTDWYSFTLEIFPPPDIFITLGEDLYKLNALPDAYVGISYQYINQYKRTLIKFPESYFGDNIKYTITGSLPQEMEIQSYNNLVAEISGTPTEAGSFTFSVSLELCLKRGDYNYIPTGYKIEKQFTINSYEYPKILQKEINIDTMTVGKEIEPIDISKCITGGKAPVSYSFSDSESNVSNGLTLDKDTGILSGTPKYAGSNTFSIIAIDANATRYVVDLSSYINTIKVNGVSNLDEIKANHPDGSSFLGSTEIVLSLLGGSDIEIYYTLDGTTPDLESAHQTNGAFSLNLEESCILQARAYQEAADGLHKWGQKFTANYTKVSAPVAPAALPGTGLSFSGNLLITLESKTAGATIYYTTDGTDPTLSSCVYSGPFTINKSCTVKAMAFIPWDGIGSETAEFSYTYVPCRFTVEKNTSDKTDAINWTVEGELLNGGVIYAAKYLGGRMISVQSATAGESGGTGSFSFETTEGAVYRCYLVEPKTFIAIVESVIPS